MLRPFIGIVCLGCLALCATGVQPVRAEAGASPGRASTSPAARGTSYTIDGLRVALTKYSLPARAPTEGRLLKPKAGRRWLRTIWNFHDLSGKRMTVHPPEVYAGAFHDHARYLGILPVYVIKPKESLTLEWYFEVPTRARQVSLTYTVRRGTVLPFHLNLR